MPGGTLLRLNVKQPHLSPLNTYYYTRGYCLVCLSIARFFFYERPVQVLL